MAHQVITQTRLEIFDCYRCGAPIALGEALYRRLKDSGDEFWCPNGHSQVFRNNRDAQIKELKRQVDVLTDRTKHASAFGNRMADNWNKEKRQHAATKGQLTKTRKRVQNGVCTDCNRTFSNLARHMASKHADAVST